MHRSEGKRESNARKPNSGLQGTERRHRRQAYLSDEGKVSAKNAKCSIKQGCVWRSPALTVVGSRHKNSSRLSKAEHVDETRRLTTHFCVVLMNPQHLASLHMHITRTHSLLRHPHHLPTHLCAVFMYVNEFTALLASSSTRWYTPTSDCCAATVRDSCAMTMRPSASTFG